MAVTDVTPTQSYTISGTQVDLVHPIPFQLLSSSDLKLYVNGVISTDGFVVSGIGTGSIGVVTDIDYPDQTVVTFEREVSYSQQTDFTTGEAIPGQRIEDALDNAIVQVQQARRDIDRSPKVKPGGEIPTGNITKTNTTSLGINSTGGWVSRTASEEIAFLGIGETAADAALAESSKIAAAVSAVAALASANSASSDAAAVGSPVSYAESQTLSTAQQGAAQTNLGIPGGVIGINGGYGSEHIVYIAATTAVSDGASNSSQVIQDALDLHGDEPARIVFPAGGNYMCQSLVLSSNTTLEMNDCILRFGGLVPEPAVHPEAPNTQRGIIWAAGSISTHIENIRITGGSFIGATSNAGNYDGIQLLLCDNVILENLKVKTWGQDGIELKDCNNVDIRNNLIEDIYDAAIECRAGTNVRVYNNTLQNIYDGFMTKPHLHEDNVTKTYATNYHVYNNVIKPRQRPSDPGHGILNNWANASVFENNWITPWTTSTNIIAITTEEHPITLMANESQYGIVIRNNTFSGTTTNTAFRSIFPPSGLSTRHEATIYDGNRVEGSCLKAFDLNAKYEIRNSFVELATGEALYSKTQGDCIVTNNDFSAKTVRFLFGEAGHVTTVNDNKFAAVVHSKGFIKGRGNEFLFWKSDSEASGLELHDSYHNSAGTISDWITCYPNNAVLNGLDFTTSGNRARGVMMYGADSNITNFSFKSNTAAGTPILKEAIEISQIYSGYTFFTFNLPSAVAVTSLTINGVAPFSFSPSTSTTSVTAKFDSSAIQTGAYNALINGSINSTNQYISTATAFATPLIEHTAKRCNVSNGVSISGDFYGGTAITLAPQIEIAQPCIDASITNVKTFGGLNGFKIYANSSNLIGCRATGASGADIWIQSGATDTHLTHCQVGVLSNATLGYKDSGTSTVSTNNRF
tara:strand:- start:813 stop:3566 length:2754 start_codon:yes stop_codon:yes gene_type:complete